MIFLCIFNVVDELAFLKGTEKLYKYIILYYLYHIMICNI